MRAMNRFVAPASRRPCAHPGLAGGDAGATNRKRMPALLVLLIFSFLPSLLSAQTVTLFDRIQSAFQTRDATAYLSLVSSNPDVQTREKKFIEDLLHFDYQTAVFQMAEESQNRLAIHVFLAGAEEARLESWLITTTTEGDRTVITQRRAISSVTGLYRLRMPDQAIPVKDVILRHLDATFNLKQGNLFPITAGGLITGVVFLGNGSLEFSPPSPTEQQQLTLFCKRPQLQTSLEYFYIRSSAESLRKLFGALLDAPGNSAPNPYQKAQAIAEEGNRNAFNVSVPLTNELWFPRVEQNDFYCEIKTAYGILIYQFSAGEKDDVLLAHKEKEHIISLYSTKKIAARAQYKEDYHILSYQMRLAFDPRTLQMNANTSMRVSTTEETSTIVFKLNPQLRVTRIGSSQGPLIHFQESKTKNLHVVLNESLQPGDELSLQFVYQGRVEPETGKTEAQVTVGGGEPDVFVPPTYLYSNQTLWYPQLAGKIFCPVETTITVPTDYSVITNGKMIKSEIKGDQIIYSFASENPMKYFSMLVGRLNGHFVYDSIVPIDVYYYSIDRKAADDFAKNADRILRFYSEYFGPYPYENLTLVLRPFQEPGGHAPGSVAIINRVFTFFQLRFRKDPLFIPEFPNFLLAHELAHQWWGQAVGWRDYQDQWLSEGFAQFAAWEFIRLTEGDKGFSELAHTFTEWVEEKTYAGPIVLGARLGHLSDDPKAFSAVIYNKGAYVLNMLKNWIGAEEFRKCMNDFYQHYRFRFAGIPEFIETAQKHSSEDLTPFFDQWLRRWDLPSLEGKARVNGNVVRLSFHQSGDTFYVLKVPVYANDRDGRTYQTSVLVDAPDKEVEIQIPFAPQTVTFDPLHENLLREK